MNETKKRVRILPTLFAKMPYALSAKSFAAFRGSVHYESDYRQIDRHNH